MGNQHSAANSIKFKSSLEALGDFDTAKARMMLDKYMALDMDFGICPEDVQKLFRECDMGLDGDFVEEVMQSFPSAAKSKILNALDFIEGFTILSYGTYDDKAALMFDIFDFQKRQEISFDEMTIMLMCAAQGVYHLSGFENDLGPIDDKKVADMLRADFEFDVGEERDIPRDHYLIWVKEKGPPKTITSVSTLLNFLRGTPNTEEGEAKTNDDPPKEQETKEQEEQETKEQENEGENEQEKQEDKNQVASKEQEPKNEDENSSKDDTPKVEGVEQSADVKQDDSTPADDDDKPASASDTPAETSNLDEEKQQAVEPSSSTGSPETAKDVESSEPTVADDAVEPKNEPEAGETKDAPEGDETKDDSEGDKPKSEPEGDDGDKAEDQSRTVEDNGELKKSGEEVEKDDDDRKPVEKSVKDENPTPGESTGGGASLGADGAVVENKDEETGSGAYSEDNEGGPGDKVVDSPEADDTEPPPEEDEATPADAKSSPENVAPDTSVEAKDSREADIPKAPEEEEVSETKA